MFIKCPNCNQVCEADEKPAVGQSLICPFCEMKFIYDNRLDDMQSSANEATPIEEKDVTEQEFRTAKPKSRPRTKINVHYKVTKVSLKSKIRFCRECGSEISSRAVVCPKCGIPTCDTRGKVSGHNFSGMLILRTVLISISSALTLIIASMWIYGYLTAMSDFKDGQNLVGYKLRRNQMNFISAEGYSYYFKHNTDIESVRKRVEERIKRADKEIERLQHQLENSYYYY